MNEIKEALEWADWLEKTALVKPGENMHWARSHVVVLAREYRKAASDLESARAEGRMEAISQCKAIVDELIEIGEKKRKWLKNEMTLLAEGREKLK